MRKNIVAGNWKMNLSLDEGLQLAEKIKGHQAKGVEVILIPPYIHLASIANLIEDSKVKLGAQNCHTEQAGAFTGEISAAMLSSCSVSYCLVGHSERRNYFSEGNRECSAKINALLDQGMQAILCCGEALEDRKAGKHFDTVKNQLQILQNFSSSDMKHIIIAYEPVWAIGTGETASAEQAQEMHAFIRSLLTEYFDEEIANRISILYGGSCKPDNAQELFSQPDVDGGLIGGASLKAEDFLAIIDSFS